MIAALEDKVCVITGANTGIGRVTALEIARGGAQVLLACRNEDKTRAVIDEIKEQTGNERLEYVKLDLASLDSVRACADAIGSRDLPIHLLINNAGLAAIRGETADGFEMAFGVNHVGHFLFTRLLLDKIKAAAPARIVTVASKAHYRAKGIDWDDVRKPTRTYVGMHEYSVSKLANVLFSAELARRLDGTDVTTYSLHPGVIASEIWRRIPWPFRSLAMAFMNTVEQGAETTLYCATDNEVAAESGQYYDDCERRHPSRVARDEALQKELWERSEAWVS